MREDRTKPVLERDIPARLFDALAAVASLQMGIERVFNINWNEMKNSPIECTGSISHFRSIVDTRCYGAYSEIDVKEEVIPLNAYALYDWPPAIIAVSLGYSSEAEQFVFSNIREIPRGGS